MIMESPRMFGLAALIAVGCFAAIDRALAEPPVGETCTCRVTCDAGGEAVHTIPGPRPPGADCCCRASAVNCTAFASWCYPTPPPPKK